MKTDKESCIMKRALIIMTLVCVLVGLGILWADRVETTPHDKAGTRVDPGQLHTARFIWVVLDTTSSAGDEPVDIDDSEASRSVGGDVTYQRVKTLIAAAANGDHEISVFDVPRNWNGARFRAIGITDGATVTYQVYAGTLGDGNRDIDSTTADCELAYIGQYAFTIGTQASTTSTYEMADTLVVTPSDWTKPASGSDVVSSPTGNRVAEGRVDLIGADVLVFVPTVVTADCKLLGKGF